MDLKQFARAITMALAMAVFAVAPLSAQTADTDIPEAIADAFSADFTTCADGYSVFDPHASALCLSKMLVRHHDALLPYSKFVIENADAIASPGADSHPFVAQGALATTAALLGDPGLCAELGLPAMRANCVAAIAQIDDDPRRCEALHDPRDAVFCLAYYIEIDPGDVGDCRRLGDIGIDGEDIGRVTAADPCLGAAARLNDTPGLCREIENPELRSMCILASMMPPPEGWTDFGICDEIVGVNLNDPEEQVGVTSPEGLRELCGTMAALAAIDSPQALSLCDGIEMPVLRDACLAGAANTQKDGSYCDHIASEALRKVCLGALAGVADEGTQAAADAFMDEFLAAIGDYDAPDQVADGHFGDAAICTVLLHEPADCTLTENRITFKLSGDRDVEGIGTIVAEVPMGRVGGVSWEVPAVQCPVSTAHGEITLTGGFAGILSRETMRGRAQVEWRFDPMISPSEGARCGPKTLVGHDGTWEATLRDGSIEGALGFGVTVIPFVADLKAE